MNSASGGVKKFIEVQGVEFYPELKVEFDNLEIYIVLNIT